MGKRGQMEIIGILVIIVLLILGLLFVVRFSGSGDSRADLAKRVKQKEIASNMLNAILRSKADNCRNLRVTDIVKDCAEFLDAGLCPQGGSITCPDPDSAARSVCSCTYVQKTLETIFESTLTEWVIDYEFSLKKGHREIFSLKPNTCRFGSDAADYWVPTSGAHANLQLRICDNT